MIKTTAPICLVTDAAEEVTDAPEEQPPHNNPTVLVQSRASLNSSIAVWLTSPPDASPIAPKASASPAKKRLVIDTDRASSRHVRSGGISPASALPEPKSKSSGIFGLPSRLRIVDPSEQRKQPSAGGVTQPQYAVEIQSKSTQELLRPEKGEALSCAQLVIFPNRPSTIPVGWPSET